MRKLCHRSLCDALEISVAANWVGFPACHLAGLGGYKILPEPLFFRDSFATSDCLLNYSEGRLAKILFRLALGWRALLDLLDGFLFHAPSMAVLGRQSRAGKFKLYHYQEARIIDIT